MFLIIFTVIVLYLFREFYWKRRNLPPGPLPISFLGNVLYLIWYPPGFKAFDLFKKTYGSVYTFWFGPYPMVFVADFEVLKETFVRDGDSYIDKFSFSDIQKEFRGGSYGVIDVNGDQWRDHRRFALHQLRDLGLGKGAMEERITIEADFLVKNILREAENGEVNVVDHIHSAVGSVINQLLVGYRFDDSRKHEFDNLMKLIDKQLELASTTTALITLVFPWARGLPGLKHLWLGLMEMKDGLHAFFTEQIKEHEAEIDYSSEQSRDFIEAYLKEKKKREAEGDMESFSHIQLINVCFDMWTAGLETTAATLSYSVVYLLNHPDVVDKMHEEMDRVCGDRNLTMADKNDLPYTLAVVTECQRFLNLLPVNTMHMTTKDVEIRGHKIAKGTTIVAMISTVMYDEKTFPDAYSFKPERFIGPDGKFLKVEEMIPFSIGKRACLGEGIAKMELFLMLANMFKRLNISCSPAPSMERNPKHLLPLPFKCTVTKRS